MRSLVVLTWLLAGSPAAPVQITAKEDAARPEVLAPGAAAKLPAALSQEEGEQILRFCVLDANGKEGPAIWGAYARRGTDLVFRPRHPLIPGQVYRATLLGNPPAVAEYRLPPRAPRAPAVVKGIYPGAEVLPANVLRFSIVFSRPMRGGAEIFDQIRILDEDGKEVADPWLLEEIWSPDGTRLILYIHPGRIKWGVLLRDLLGPVFLPDRRYRLVISPEMRDADGQKLGKEFSKAFRTTAEERTRIELKAWKVQSPPAGSREALVIELPRPLDHFSLQNFLSVRDPEGSRVEGAISLSKDQKTWKFAPAAAWKAGGHRLVVDARLEDVAGNTPRAPFDLDQTAAPLPEQDLYVGFRPRSAPGSR